MENNRRKFIKNWVCWQLVPCLFICIPSGNRQNMISDDHNWFYGSLQAIANLKKHVIVLRGSVPAAYCAAYASGASWGLKTTLIGKFMTVSWGNLTTGLLKLYYSIMKNRVYEETWCTISKKVMHNIFAKVTISELMKWTLDRCVLDAAGEYSDFI